VPPPLRRAIHRVSALLETVDLEFERVLEERKNYVENEIVNLDSNEPLNVDIVQSILSELLPPKNRDKIEGEDYAELLRDLNHFDINTANELRILLASQMKAILSEEAKVFDIRIFQDSFDGTTRERQDEGVFFTHVGLTRQALREKFGDQAFTDWYLAQTNEDILLDQ
jgi:hypothetical protein